MQSRRLPLWLATAFVFYANAVAGQDSSCRRTAGPERSAGYVRQCLEVSPATRPPCNAENACDLIIDEIARGCRLIRQDLAMHPEWRQTSGLREPVWCAAYIGDRR